MREQLRDELKTQIDHELERRDDCERCHGERGGVRGNENFVNGVLLCDYCCAEDLLRIGSGE